MNTKLFVTKTVAAFASASLAAATGTVRKAWARNNVCRFAQLVKLSLASVMLLGSGLQTVPAHARPVTDPPPEQKVDCRGLQGTISTKDRSVDLWGTSTLSWNVTVPRGCTDLNLYVAGIPVTPTGSRSIQPLSTATYRLEAMYGNSGRRELGSATIKVTLPNPLPITANSLVPTLLQALQTANQHIIVANQVELDLSYVDAIPVASGVTLEGGRTAREPGPRLFTTTRPLRLFNITGDNVRITGVRLEGADMGVVEGDAESIGIFVRPSVEIRNVEIDHNELSGWCWAAVQVWDVDDKIAYPKNHEAVRIHDNFIHHNQHSEGNGYGVAVGHGAYALIDRNVFDYNRHAISGEDGSDGSGFLAYENLILENGGLQRDILGIWTHAQQFDMHAQHSCGLFSYNCGPAGEYMDIRYNSFFYTEKYAFELRGTPSIAADVTNNVFAHGALFTTVVQTAPTTSQVVEGALAQHETGLYPANNAQNEPGPHSANNLVGVNAMHELGSCDFDGDGLNDLFLATGQTWWYSSGGDKPWVYLNRSKKRRTDITLGFFDGDNRCDVLVDGVIYPGGKPQQPSSKTPSAGSGTVSATR